MQSSYRSRRNLNIILFIAVIALLAVFFIYIVQHRRDVLSRQEQSTIDSGLSDIEAPSPLTRSAEQLNKELNILLITVDSLRADHLGAYGYERSTTPWLDVLSEESVLFENAYSQAGWTLPSLTTIMTSLYPHQHGCEQDNAGLSLNATTLAEVLLKNGYRTSAYVSHYFCVEGFRLDQGFEDYDVSALSLGDPHKVSSAQYITEKAIQEMEKTVRPFFTWIHYFDPHFDYMPHPQYHFGDKRIDRYDSEIAVTDAAIGDLMVALKQKDLYDSTVIIVTADHGEEFQEHKGIYHNTLYEEVVRTPLIMRVPEREAEIVSDEYVEQTDLAPSILALADIEPLKIFSGSSIWDAKKKRQVFLSRKPIFEHPQRFAVIEDGWKLIITNSPSGVEQELYDLNDDPQERKNLSVRNSRRQRRLVSVAENFFQVNQAIFKPKILVSDKVLEKLAAMGYVHGSAYDAIVEALEESN